jgi:predicted lipoprotein with Yx(FWY)xxD motif
VSVTRARTLTGGLAVLTAVVLAACSSGGNSSTRPKPTATTKSLIGSGLDTTLVTVHPSAYGNILTAAYPATLYVNVDESAHHNTCTGQCAKTWFPLLTRGQPQAGEGVSGNLLGSFRRDDGRRQVTYNGHPLYTYRGDHQPVEAKGQGASGRWYVISASGDPVKGQPS